MALLVGKYDTLATLKDNEENRPLIGKNKGGTVIFYEEYELDHLSFVLANDMSHMDDVIKILE